MSDYIRKQDVIDLINGLDSLPWEEETKEIVDTLPTLDEKEIICKTVERIVERLEQSRDARYFLGSGKISANYLKGLDCAFYEAIDIVKEVGGIE